MRLWIVAVCIAAASCVSASGAGDRPAPFAPAIAESAAEYDVAVDLPAGAYRLDPRHASVIFRIRHMELAWFTARFDVRDATLELDPDDPSRSRLEASVDATSVNTGVLNAAGERSFDRAIARALGGETTSSISFVSTGVERTGAHTARVVGELTMNGESHPMTLVVTFDGGRVDPLRGGAMVLGFSAYGVIDRSLWGVTQWGSFAGDEVQIVIEAELVRA